MCSDRTARLSGVPFSYRCNHTCVLIEQHTSRVFPSLNHYHDEPFCTKPKALRVLQNAVQAKHVYNLSSMYTELPDCGGCGNGIWHR
jgi:hypothetical protein